jgi:hypothetical protein
MPYFFKPIAIPNCDEVFPDGGIVPPFADSGADDAAATDAASDGGAAADAGDGSDAGATTGVEAGAGDASETGTVTDASADISVGAEGGTDGAKEAAAGDAASDAASPACYEFLYDPACNTGACWAGVIFTQSAGGLLDPGVCIEPGATKITFKAKASRPNARIKFGSIREGMGTTEFYLNITTDWATYEVTIPAGEPYNSYSAGGEGVWNGFSVILEPQDHPGGTYVFVKDAVWMK